MSVATQEVPMLALRPYQSAQIDALEREWSAGADRLAVVSPTGTGKTVVLAHLAAQHVRRGGKVAVVVHRDELAGQTVRKLAEVGMTRVGVVKAERNELDAPVIVVSVQSTASPARRAALAACGVTLVIVDECHHATASTYVALLTELGCFEAFAATKAAGFTATLSRGDGVALGRVWQKIAYQGQILDFIRQGYLLDAKGIRVTLDMDMSRIARSGGDYQDGALGEAMHEALAAETIARAYVEHAGDRAGILFAPTVDTAHECAQALNAAGITARSVWGAMPLESRREILRDYAAGRVQVLTNCMVLTEGFDAPQASAVVIARPTSSAPLYVQMVGRVLRPFPGQTEALVIDVVGVGARHRLASLADLSGVEPRPDKTMVESVEIEEAEAAGRQLVIARNGKTKSEEFDLFGRSRQTWLRTGKGVWFLSVGDFVVFLAPGSDPGTYTVCKAPVKAAGGEWVKENVDLGYAMAWGEQVAAGVSQVLTSKRAGWRKDLPSDGQISAAASWRIPVLPGMTKGELSDAISVAVASRRIDSMPMFRELRPMTDFERAVAAPGVAGSPA